MFISFSQGRPSGVFVKLSLTADKPFTRKVNALLSHNADCFGSPCCNCKDKDLFNFTHDKKTHYGQITFETLCNRAHWPLWKVLGEPEPEDWSFTCDCCKTVHRCCPDPNVHTQSTPRDEHAELAC